jgi:hypothetical protein
MSANHPWVSRYQRQAFQMLYMSYELCSTVRCIRCPLPYSFLSVGIGRLIWSANAISRDLLQRHYTVHGRNQNNEEGLPPQGIIPKSAGRTPIACSNCAKTKTKCDKKFPCTRCAQRNLKCTLRPTRRASKGVQRVGGPPEAGSGDSSESGSNADNHNTSGNVSPNHDNQPKQATTQSSPSQIQQSSHIADSQPPSQRQSQSPSAPHSRNPSISQPVQPPPHINPEEKSIHMHMPISDTPPFFDQSPSNGLTQSSSLLSPLPTPVTGMSGFVTSTPMSGMMTSFGRCGISLIMRARSS